MYETILLHSASYQGTPEMVETLLNHGVKLNAKNHWSEVVLHVVSRCRQDSQGEVRVAKLLLERGMDVNTRRKDHWTPLHLASYFGNVKIVRLLLDNGADLEAAEGKMGEKPIHQVSYGKYRSQEDGIRVAQLLLEHGAYVNTRRKDHWTPLHLASYFGNVEIVRLLLDSGADPEANAEVDMGAKPLHEVSRGKYRSQEDGVGIARLLLERGADVNTRRKDHQTPLHIASCFGKFEIVHLLLDYGAKVDTIDKSGKTPLHEVSKGKYESQEDGVRVARLLLDHGADVNTKARSGDTPQALASGNQKPNLAKLFLEHAASVNTLRRSANPNHVVPVEVRINTINHAGNTPSNVDTQYITDKADGILASHGHDNPSHWPSETTLFPFNPKLYHYHSQSSTPPSHSSLASLPPTTARGRSRPSGERELSPGPDVAAKVAQSMTSITCATPQPNPGVSTSLPDVSLDGAAAPTTNPPAEPLFPSLTPSLSRLPITYPEHTAGRKSDDDGILTPSSTWWSNSKRKRTIIKQAEGYMHTRSVRQFLSACFTNSYAL